MPKRFTQSRNASRQKVNGRREELYAGRTRGTCARPASRLRENGRLMKVPFAGGCVCGAIRYECTEQPVVTFNCHCRDCQQLTGAFSPVVYVPAKALHFTRGHVRYYSTPSVSGGFNKRGFCEICGSRISGGETDEGIGIVAGTLDDPSQFRAQMDIWTSDAHPWHRMDPDLPKFPQNPPRG